eukprot:Rmarinus@m.13413
MPMPDSLLRVEPVSFGGAYVRRKDTRWSAPYAPDRRPTTSGGVCQACSGGCGDVALRPCRCGPIASKRLGGPGYPTPRHSKLYDPSRLSREAMLAPPDFRMPTPASPSCGLLGRGRRSSLAPCSDEMFSHPNSPPLPARSTSPTADHSPTHSPSASPMVIASRPFPGSLAATAPPTPVLPSPPLRSLLYSPSVPSSPHPKIRTAMSTPSFSRPMPVNPLGTSSEVFHPRTASNASPISQARDMDLQDVDVHVLTTTPPMRQTADTHKRAATSCERRWRRGTRPRYQPNSPFRHMLEKEGDLPCDRPFTSCALSGGFVNWAWPGSTVFTTPEDDATERLRLAAQRKPRLPFDRILPPQARILSAGPVVKLPHMSSLHAGGSLADAPSDSGRSSPMSTGKYTDEPATPSGASYYALSMESDHSRPTTSDAGRSLADVAPQPWGR